jgi:hypothetical protein
MADSERIFTLEEAAEMFRVTPRDGCGSNDEAMVDLRYGSAHRRARESSFGCAFSWGDFMTQS